MHNRISLFLFSLLLSMAFFITGCAKKSHTLYEKKTSIARHKSTLKPYTVKGKKYYPRLVSLGEKQYGISSWYGPNFHGKATSNGEKYNMYSHTAAHKTFPMDTVVRVKNLENGKSTVVRINDRGPFVSGRIIDCSYSAGKAIGLDKMGIAKVEVTVLDVSKKSYKAKKLMHKTVSSQQKLKKIECMKNDIGIQVGAYRALNGAIACSHAYRRRYGAYESLIKKVTKGGDSLYHVWLVGFKNKEELEQFKNKLSTITERM